MVVLHMLRSLQESYLLGVAEEEEERALAAAGETGPDGVLGATKTVFVHSASNREFAIEVGTLKRLPPLRGVLLVKRCVSGAAVPFRNVSCPPLLYIVPYAGAPESIVDPESQASVLSARRQKSDLQSMYLSMQSARGSR